MDPLPDARRVRESLGDEQLPADMSPVYVCLDPDSGAIGRAPSGARGRTRAWWRAARASRLRHPALP